MKWVRTKGQRGQTLVEYVIIIVVMSLMSLAILSAFSGKVHNIISGAISSISNDSPGTVDDDAAKDALKNAGSEAGEITIDQN
ncbi:MAG: hypothetical protein PHQ27_01845 [Victivallales bacterium]|nr:hypothetical protein [Victivallales bacterium]